MELLCISASNIINKKANESTSYQICEIIAQKARQKIPDLKSTIIELKNFQLEPCVGCGQCYHSHRCVHKDDFNNIYEQAIKSNIIFIVSAHYAPIPAKLSIILEKMEQITFLHWGRDNSYKAELHGIPVGVVSHGGGARWALKSYKAMVNDTIANALDTIQLKLVPYSEEWDTGISLPVCKVTFSDDNVFPIQEYDWDSIETAISEYVSKVVEEIN